MVTQSKRGVVVADVLDDPASGQLGVRGPAEVVRCVVAADVSRTHVVGAKASLMTGQSKAAPVTSGRLALASRARTCQRFTTWVPSVIATDELSGFLGKSGRVLSTVGPSISDL